jgi:hypothetical protein
MMELRVQRYFRKITLYLNVIVVGKVIDKSSEVVQSALVHCASLTISMYSIGDFVISITAQLAPFKETALSRFTGIGLF